VTDKVSTQVRTLAIGLIAFTWTALTTDTPTVKAMAALVWPWLLLMAAFCFAALLADYGQYVCARMVVDEAYAHGKDGCNQFSYNTKMVPYRAQTWFYLLKQALLGGGVLMAVVTVLAVLVLKWPGSLSP
jgi:hypothetical protein